jgi:hypothetical protein
MKYFFEALGIQYAGELLIRGVDKAGEVREHPTALSEAFELGRSLAKQ